MTEKNQFKILISSDLQFEELCAEVYFEDAFVALITREEGVEKAILYIEQPKKTKDWVFNLHDFLSILKKARESLIRIDEPKQQTIGKSSNNCIFSIMKRNKESEIEILYNKNPLFYIFKEKEQYFVQIFGAHLDRSLGFRLSDVVFILEKAKNL